MVVGAMAGSTQNNPGDFAAMAIAMTPGPSPSPTSQGPTGTTPNAKRPMDKNTITIAQTGVRLMTQEDLSQSVHNLIGKQVKDEQFTTDISDCVKFNSELLNAIIVRVNTVEAAVKLSDTKTDYFYLEFGGQITGKIFAASDPKTGKCGDAVPEVTVRRSSESDGSGRPPPQKRQRRAARRWRGRWRRARGRSAASATSTAPTSRTTRRPPAPPRSSARGSRGRSIACTCYFTFTFNS